VNDALYVSALLDSFRVALPEIVLGAAACVLFVGGLFRADRQLWAAVSLLALVGAGFALYVAAGDSDVPESARYIAPAVLDPLAVYFLIVTLGGGVVLVLFSWDQVPDSQAADYYACLLLILAGLGLTGSANDLVTLFAALELVSIPTYIILYLPKHDTPAQEAALKYFLLSVFSSALTLFGFSYLYGIAGTTNLPLLLQALNAADAGTLPWTSHVALIMVLAGLGFRVTMVPFHFYAPDVYQGTATVLAALLAFVTKVAGFAAIVRVLGFVLPPNVLPRDNHVGLALSGQAWLLLWLLAALTMTVGNVFALRQDNLKRLLAYSSVAHAGYMLIALAVAPYLSPAALAVPGTVGEPEGVDALLYYLVAYAAMTVGAFAGIAYLDTPARPVENVDDLAGLSVSQPGVALLMLIFLFSLIGIPLTAGFTGKLLIFVGAMAVPSVTTPDQVGIVAGGQAGLYRVLALIGVLNAAVGAWYYLRIIAVMYLRTPLRPPVKRWAWPGLATMLVCAILTVGLSVGPGLDWLRGVARLAGAPQGPPGPTGTARR
jgi:NADH-quinone oxidoreductase subunit N